MVIFSSNIIQLQVRLENKYLSAKEDENWGKVWENIRKNSEQQSS